MVLTITLFVLLDSFYALATPKLIVPTEFKVSKRKIPSVLP